MNNFCAVTVFFNPAGFSALLNNYFRFAEALKEQGVPLLTVECAFNGADFQIPEGPLTYRLRSNSVMWQKERLINYGVSKLPPAVKYYAWIDCDVLFPVGDWAEMAVQKLQTADVIQLYKKVHYMPPGMLKYDGSKVPFLQSVLWQYKIHHNWLARRRAKQLGFATPGFAWACRRELFEDIGGMYDRNIVGSGDTFLVDCYLDSWDIHGFADKFSDSMKQHLMDWCSRLRAKNPKVDYLPLDIAHLWHGNLKNRKYMDRHDVIKKYNYDPATDIKLVNDVYEWATDKPGMHEDIRQYFFNRKEDEEGGEAALPGAKKA
jgi:hypothetical protein